MLCDEIKNYYDGYDCLQEQKAQLLCYRKPQGSAATTNL